MGEGTGNQPRYKWYTKVNTLMWTAIFIWAGLVLLPGKINLITAVINWNFLSLIFTGAGIIIIIAISIYMYAPESRPPLAKKFILALIMLGTGLQGVLGWRIVWPIILIAIGLYIAVRGFRAQRNENVDS